MEWIGDHLTAIILLLMGASASGLEARWRILSRVGSRCLQTFECEFHRSLCEERERATTEEIRLLRADVRNLQGDIERLQRRFAASGAGSPAAPRDARTPDRRGS